MIKIDLLKNHPASLRSLAQIRMVSRTELPDKFPFFYEDDLFMIKDSWE